MTARPPRRGRVRGRRPGPFRCAGQGAPERPALPPPAPDRRDPRATRPLPSPAPVGGTGRPDATHPLKPGSTLLLYTDGLVETPGSDLGTGLDRLRRHALALAHEPLDTLCGDILAHLPPGSTDDVALLALRVPPP
ncbi:SpoIIE family protein phosphatase [Streptomyces griseoincarnatus]